VLQTFSLHFSVVYFQAHLKSRKLLIISIPTSMELAAPKFLAGLPFWSLPLLLACSFMLQSAPKNYKQQDCLALPSGRSASNRYYTGHEESKKYR